MLLPMREMDGPVNPGDHVVVMVACSTSAPIASLPARFNRGST